MQVAGIVVHHSACSSINGKGYDFMITRQSVVIPGMEPTEPSVIHVCLEGDFSVPDHAASGSMLMEVREQFFVAGKLILKLIETYGIPPENIKPHGQDCPGPHFPWAQLVISISDRYH